MFTKILIANRGEIAVRVVRACHELGIRTVAVYSEADRLAMHTALADEAVLLGPAAPQESYLNVDRVLDAALQSGAQMIHPGYGFLAENADFAQAVVEAGLTFIGPGADAIRVMGDKAVARARMEATGVPILPGYQGADETADLQQAAEALGYPLLIKAAAGGGGRGMRVVSAAADLNEAAAAARRESESAFGDGRLILERFIPDARHIEFQILADQEGNVLHLFERECSIQRRHQKIIEETPSPLLDPELRAEMGAAAAAAARAVGYVNAGTVEFVVDPDTRAFYFIEMNTRLQVEHPVTELTTGVDLVGWQLRIADGERLPFRQEDITPSGHAIECRLYAEDPEQQFLPAAGRLLKFVPPVGPGLRVDAGVSTGDEVGVHYDPLIAKVIVFAEDRALAIRKMEVALRQTVVLGLTTNLAFLRAVLAHPEFQMGEATTRFIDRHFSGWRSPEREAPAAVLIAAALSEQTGAPSTAGQTGTGDPYSPWGHSDGFRLGS